MADITGIAPEEMADLTRQFIGKKTVNDRVAIRLRMKAILDYLSTDTEFPANPLLKKDPGPTPARDAAMMGVPMQQAAFQTVYPVAASEPIPGAARVDNTEILG
jgi:hypothetical protein